MYRSNTRIPVSTFNFVCYQGGLGDLLGQLPAIKYSLDNHPQLEVKLYVHKYAIELCQKVFAEYGDRITVKSTENNDKDYDDKLPARSPYAHKISNLSWHITDHAFATMVGRSVTPNHMNYLQMKPIKISEFVLPERYAVITTGFTSKAREWKPESVNGVTDWLVSQGITPVYIGKSNTPAHGEDAIIGNFHCNYENGINYIDYTDLFQAHAIMAGAEVVIGLDNGLLHLAAMSDVPIVAGFTTVDPIHRLPYRNNVLGHNCFVVAPTKEELGCIHCQSNWNFASTDFAFTDCGYDDFKCLDLMTADRWIEQIQKALNINCKFCLRKKDSERYCSECVPY